MFNPNTLNRFFLIEGDERSGYGNYGGSYQQPNYSQQQYYNSQQWNNNNSNNPQSNSMWDPYSQ